MKKYIRITEKERYLIEQGILAKKSIRQIAEELDRAPKTISAEIARNGGKLRYYAVKAHFYRNISNKKGYSKIENNAKLRRYIEEKLQQKWSPEAMSKQREKFRYGAK